MRISCPFCGARDGSEFSYLGDATPKRPKAGDPDEQGAMFDYVYLRDNPAGPLKEYWYHTAGCHSWLVVERDTRTHGILNVHMADHGSDA
jgi:heterotetrameric sarcosine oxidase delta subunit